MKCFRSLSILVAILFFQSCYVSKPLDTEVHVSLSETMDVKITKDEGATFITFFNEEDYRKAFLDAMKASLALDKIIVDNVNPQFIISIMALELNEMTTTDTVKDEKSKDNGKIFDIAVGKLKAAGTLVNTTDQKSSTWTADKDKHERLTSMQSAGQMIKGDNKDLSEYRKKDFDRNEFVSLAGDCGRRSASVISNAIRRQLK